MASVIRAWVAALRPRTLPAALVPVAVGVAAATRHVAIDWLVAATTLAAALLIQIGTNLANDYYDFLKGADDEHRLGPTRAVQAGLLAPAAVRTAAFASLASAALAGVFLVRVGGWPISAVGALSLAAAVGYTGGPWPLAYHGLGDLFVFVFFGVVAVCGTVYLQAGRIDATTFLSSLVVGCGATAILVVNNLRDIPTDARAGKRTLAVRIGERATRRQFAALVAIAFAVCALIVVREGGGTWLAFAALPLAWIECRAIGCREGSELNRSLAGTARLHLVLGVCLALGLLT